MKKILTVILCLVMLFGVSGCSSNSKEISEEVIDKNETTEKKDDEETAKTSTKDKQNNIKDLKAAIPNPKDYLENDERVKSERYGEGNNTYVYTIENSHSRSDFYERYVQICKDAGYNLDYYESLKEDNDEPLNVSNFRAFLIDNDSYEVMISYYPNDDVVIIIIKHVID